MSADRLERERKRVDARRKEDKTGVKQRGQRRPGMGMILHLSPSFLSSFLSLSALFSFSLCPSLCLCLCVYGCLYRCLSIYERYDHQV